MDKNTFLNLRWVGNLLIVGRVVCRCHSIHCNAARLAAGNVGPVITLNQQRERDEAAAGTQARTFTIDGVVLKKIENFKYSGLQISSRDCDNPALFINLTKVRKRLGPGGYHWAHYVEFASSNAE